MLPRSPPVLATRRLIPSRSRGAWAEQDGIVPGYLGQRLGQFLQPAVVGEAAVENARIGTEEHIQRRAGGGSAHLRRLLFLRRDIRRRQVLLDRRLPRSRRALRHDAVMKRRAPKWLEVAAGFALLLPIGPHEFVACAAPVRPSGPTGVRGRCGRHKAARSSVG